MKSILRKKPGSVGQRPNPEPTHPLPWRNLPADGLNHVTDANGHSVYDGSDAAEMFRLYNAEARAGRAEPRAVRRPRAGSHR